MDSYLVPRSARLFPTQKSRSFHIERNTIYTSDKFNTYNDWFYFIHIDPYLRWVHAFGMVVGVIFFSISFYNFWILGLNSFPITLCLIGTFFFYFLPLLSHYYYDGGGAKSSPDSYLSTFIPVIHINLLTLTGRYDRWLRKFIIKYPFTVEAWELVERAKKLKIP
jgi:hypothetical protein